MSLAGWIKVLHHLENHYSAIKAWRSQGRKMLALLPSVLSVVGDESWEFLF